MIYTTYFAQLRNLPTNITPISICAKAPRWYHGLQYKKLAPKYRFFAEWKETHDDEMYIRCFNDQVIRHLNVHTVVKDLNTMMSEHRKMLGIKSLHPPKVALVCYEKPDDFCHRHLVAKWLRLNGYECQEWSKEMV